METSPTETNQTTQSRLETAFEKVMAAYESTITDETTRKDLEQHRVAVTPYAGRLVVSAPGIGNEVYL